MKRTWKHLLVLMLALLTVASLASGCKSASKGNVADREPAKNEASSGDGIINNENGSSVNVPDDAERKIIKTYEIYSETKEYDAAIQALQRLVGECGGYVESSKSSDKSLNNTSDAYSRYASYTIRVPAEKAEQFVGSVGSLFNVTSSSEHVDDVSETYYSIEARLEELLAERDSLIDIMNAKETKQDYSLWLTVSERLSSVRQQIAVYQGQLNRLDSKVAYSTVELSISEVLNYSEAKNSSFGSRLGNAFVRGWESFGSGVQDFVIWVAEALPVLLLLAAIAVAVILIIRFATKKKK